MRDLPVITSVERGAPRQFVITGPVAAAGWRSAVTC
jgi:hypothetical protein